jgi:putative transposase
LFLREEAERCWIDMLTTHIESRSEKWLLSIDLSKIFKRLYALHSQTVQALAQKLEANIDTARELCKTDPEARYPHHPKKYQTVSQGAVRRRYGQLHSGTPDQSSYICFVWRDQWNCSNPLM